MGECWNCSATADDDWSCQACRTERGLAQDLADAGREIEELRAENERYYLLFTKLQDIAGDRRFSDEFVGSATRHRLNEFAAATKEDDRG